MEQLSQINHQCRQVIDIPLNKWRYGEFKENLEQDIAKRIKEIEEYRLETQRRKTKLLEQGTSHEEIEIALYTTRSLGYVALLEKYHNLRTKLSAVEKTIIGLTNEKIKVLEDLCDIPALCAAPPPPAPVITTTNPIANTTPANPIASFQYPPVSGLGLRYSV